MSKAVNIHTASRRGLLAASPAILGLAAVAAVAPAEQLPDDELMRICLTFAEAEFTAWYVDVVTHERGVVRHFKDTVPDWATLRQIEAMPARTPDGWRAKALAYVAWHRDAYDDPADDRDGHTTLLASLMRDLAAPARAAIIARLAKRYGPLPEGYTADGVWVGRVAA